MIRPPFRDGKVHVCARRCSTCIFRPGNQMSLDDGRVDGMVVEATEAQSAITCHSTFDGDQAVCRGFYDDHMTLPLMLARAMDLIVEVEPPTLRESSDA